MLPTLYLHLSREDGLSWAWDGTPTYHGKPKDLIAAAANPVAVVAWDAARRLAAVQTVGALCGSICIELSGTAPAQCDAGAVAKAYRTISPSMQKMGCPAVPSQEQWRVIDAVRQGLNVVCTAVAGAGKTTTLKLCAGHISGEVRLLTYNKSLQLNVSDNALSNMRVMTYHAAAGAAYSTVARDNAAITKLLRGGAPTNPLRFAAIMLDEAQDIDPALHGVASMLIDANPTAQRVVVGDALQSINEYRGAHPEFLTDAPELFNPRTPGALQRAWVSCKLNVSYRLTPANAQFINNHLYNANVIIGGNTVSANRKPLYIATAGFKNSIIKALSTAVTDAVREFGPGNVFVLAPSVRGLSSKSSPVAELVRHHLGGIPTYVGAGDDGKTDKDIMRDKLAILSYNSCKGCERDCVILTGFDESYFKFYEKSWEDLDRLPNVLTVAATRVRVQLVIIAAARETLRTIDTSRLQTDTELRGRPAPGKPAARTSSGKRGGKPVSVSKLVRHLHPETIHDAMRYIITVAAPDSRQRGPSIDGRARFDTDAGSYVEDLRFVYAIAPSLAAVKLTGSTTLGMGLEEPTIVATAREASEHCSIAVTEADFKSYPPTFWEDLSLACGTPCGDRTPAEWAHIAVADRALREGRHHIARQVIDYSWVDSAAMNSVRDIVVAAIEGLEGKFDVKLDNGVVVGMAQFIGGGQTWEFKLDELCETHELHVACLLALQGGGEGVLMSILHPDKRIITVLPEHAEKLLTVLLEGARPATRSAVEMVAAYRAGLPDDDMIVPADEARCGLNDFLDAEE